VRGSRSTTRQPADEPEDGAYAMRMRVTVTAGACGGPGFCGFVLKSDYAAGSRTCDVFAAVAMTGRTILI
jgi:hypothetical protein